MSQVKGLAGLESRLIRIVSGVKKGAGKGVVRMGRMITARSKKQAPVDTGEMVNSQKAKVGISESTGKFTVTITYQAIDRKTGFDYAPWQHEQLHFSHAPGKKAQFLHGAAKEIIPKLKDALVADAKKGAKRS